MLSRPLDSHSFALYSTVLVHFIVLRGVKAITFVLCLLELEYGLLPIFFRCDHW